MAGRKVFTAGEVLSAANVMEFLMDQSVMTFAGSAARGSSIGTATEGMVSYLTDTNKIEVFTTYWEQVWPVSTFAGTITSSQVSGSFAGTQRHGPLPQMRMQHLGEAKNGNRAMPNRQVGSC